jgi:hypothetical protein
MYKHSPWSRVNLLKDHLLLLIPKKNNQYNYQTSYTGCLNNIDAKYRSVINPLTNN